MKTGMDSFRLPIAIGFLSAATLLFETGLTRYLAVAQFYHFAFLVISLALLGFGASGTLIAVFPRIKEYPLERTLAWIGIGMAGCIWASFLVVEWLPFDSYSIAWERRQLLFFLIYYFAISLPFLVSGLGLGTALAVVEKGHHRIYAANLAGSGLGVLLAPSIMGLSGVVGLFIICTLVCLGSWTVLEVKPLGSKSRWLGGALVLIGLLAWTNLAARNSRGASPLGFQISPYKGLAYARQYPGSKLVFGKWGRSSRVDVIAGGGTHRLPGLSYAYSGGIPEQLGLTIDGGALQPITLLSGKGFEAGQWLPEWWALSLLDSPDALVLEPGGGFGVLQLLESSPGSVTAVMPDPLLLEAVEETAGEDQVFQRPELTLVVDNPRAFLAGEDELYDLVYLPLTDEYQPVSNGFYSISEDYSLTVEGFQAGLKRLAPGGVWVASRWLQNPPSEGLRLITTLYEGLKGLGHSRPEEAIVVHRGIQTITAAVRPDGWEQRDLEDLREFLDRARYDLVWSPDITPDQANRWNQLEEPLYYQEISALFQAAELEDFTRAYPYDISPPTDDQPFFFHFFTWAQTPAILASFGKTWQPFGGSGYFVLLFLLLLVLILSSLLILIPLWLVRRAGGKQHQASGPVFLYFGSIGIGFMFLEIPLINQWRLFLQEPVYAFSLIVGILLLSSGLGSLAAEQDWTGRGMTVPLLFLAGAGSITLSILDKGMILSWPVWLRILAACLGLAPLGFSLGTFFPRGLSWVKEAHPALVPWAWAVNGSASVIASVLAALISLQAGFPLVLLLGGALYGGAWMIRRRSVP